MKLMLLTTSILVLQPTITVPNTLISYQQRLIQIDQNIKELNLEKATIIKEISKVKPSIQKEDKKNTTHLIEPLLRIHFTWIEGGCYDMGNNLDTGDQDEKPLHKVCVDSFYMGTYEITQTQYVKVMHKNPSTIKNTYKQYPVESVSWLATQKFISRLNKQSEYKFRLPTEAEWEHAARSGNETFTYAGSNDIYDIAWGIHNDAGYIRPVGQKQPNTVGLYDMSGNVAEWCSDWYSHNYYRHKEHKNPKGPRESDKKVTRGGSFKSFMHQLRVADRSSVSPECSLDSIGFRLVFTPE